MKVDLPTPGTPEMPTRSAGSLRHRQGREQGIGPPAMVGAGRLQEGDRLGDGAALPFAARRRDVVAQGLVGGRQRCHRRAAVQCAATAWRICSRTSLALAGIGVPGP